MKRLNKVDNSTMKFLSSMSPNKNYKDVDGRISYQKTYLIQKSTSTFTHTTKAYFFNGGKVARINIEDSLYEDPRYRRMERKEGEVIAQGVVLNSYRLAQFYWTKKDSLKSRIPKNIFLSEPLMQKMIDYDLAYEDSDGFIHVRGAEESFAWLIAKHENGKKGGRPKSETKPTETEPEPKGTEIKLVSTEENLTITDGNPLSLSPALPLSPSLLLHTQGEESGKSEPEIIRAEFSQEDLIQMFNRLCAGQGEIRSFNSYSLSPEAFANFIKRTGRPEWRNPENWENFFKEVSTSDFLTGKGEEGFVATLPWVLKPDNFENILGGLFGNRKKEKNAGKAGQSNFGAKSDALFDRVIRTGRYEFKNLWKQLDATEKRAVEILGGSSLIFDCDNFTQDKIKNQLRAAYREAMEETKNG